jgi:hypothetical protein
MKLAIMQPYFFPYLGYFQLVHASDRFVFYDDVNFIKNGWINRNRFLLEGETRYFTVPLDGMSPFAAIRDVRMQPPDRPWRRKLLETLRVAYKTAPNRDAGMALVESSLATGTDSIADAARESVKSVMRYLGLERDWVESSATYGNDSLKGQERILDICARERASLYVNAPGGRDLYDARAFADAGVTLRFVQGSLPPYSQPAEPFVPGLSVLDAIMRCSASEVAAMVGAYQLVP